METRTLIYLRYELFTVEASFVVVVVSALFYFESFEVIVKEVSNLRPTTSLYFARDAESFISA
jgi:hypothetical protein